MAGQERFKVRKTLGEGAWGRVTDFLDDAALGIGDNDESCPACGHEDMAPDEPCGCDKNDAGIGDNE